MGGRSQAGGLRAFVLAVLVVAATACTVTVSGAGRPEGVEPGASSAVPLPTIEDPPSTQPAPATRPPLAADVLPDECLLDAAAVGALTGTTVAPPSQQREQDGSHCVAESGGGAQVATVDVYEPRSGTPSDFVRGGPQEGRRPLEGAGGAAVVVETPPGAVLQVAGQRYVVTIAVLDGAPTDEQWREAAEDALAALPA